MLNVYNAYAVNPAKFPSVKLQGALAFLDFLTSRPFQDALARFPSRRRPGFFPAAFPRVTLTRRLPRTVRAGTRVTVAGRLASAIPGARARPDRPARPLPAHRAGPAGRRARPEHAAVQEPQRPERLAGTGAGARTRRRVSAAGGA